MRIRSLAALALLGVATNSLAAQEHQHAAGVGDVRFPVSCAATVQPLFERAVASLHSFWFPEAERAFLEVAAADPSCGMAWWGVAMTRLGNPLAGRPTAENERVAAEAAVRAAELGGTTAREQGFIAAVGALYSDLATRDYARACRRTKPEWRTSCATIRTTSVDQLLREITERSVQPQK